MTTLNIFANQSGQIPLSELDTNFATPITIGTTPVTLGQTAGTITGLTLAGANLGTPTGNLANCTFPILNQNTTGTASNVTGVVIPGNGGTGVTTSTGSGSNVLNTSPTLVTPLLGTPTSGTLTTCTGLPLTTGITGILPVLNGGTGVTTPAIVAGTGIGVTGTWPNQTINSTAAVTSVGGTGTVNGITLTGTVTTSGNLTLGGTLSGVNLTSQVSGILPVANGGTGVTSSTGSGDTVRSTSPTLTSPIIAGTPSGVGVLTSDTAKASTSGTSIDFTGIPSWVKRITVMFSGVSTSGTSPTLIQLGYSTSSLQTTGYTGTTDEYTSAPTGAAITQAGFPVVVTRTATYTTSGALTINLLGSNTWCMSSWLSSNPGRCAYCLGYVTVAGALDRVRITSVNGTDTFDAGSINIMYE